MQLGLLGCRSKPQHAPIQVGEPGPCGGTFLRRERVLWGVARYPPPQPPPPHRDTPVGVGVLLDPGFWAPSKFSISLCWATDQPGEKTTAGHAWFEAQGNLLLAYYQLCTFIQSMLA